jgi:acetyl esterase
MKLAERLRRQAGAVVVDTSFQTLARLGRLHPRARPAAHGVEVVRDVAYTRTGAVAHRLDVYRPVHREGAAPALMYIHGGGFRILSKDTHWLMGLAFARRGYVVFNINYRLAPAHPYPAALQDACDALAWVHERAREYGADAANLVLAGESAGANLATALALAACTPRPEPWARAVFDRGVVPRAVLAACGMLQVSDPRRFARRKKLPVWLLDRIDEVHDAYLLGADPRAAGGTELADPLVLLEQSTEFARPLPPFFAFAGTADPLLDDTRRLGAALERRGVACELRYYPGEVHAFHTLVWRRQAARCWREMFEFLDRHAPAPGAPRAAAEGADASASAAEPAERA